MVPGLSPPNSHHSITRWTQPILNLFLPSADLCRVVREMVLEQTLVYCARLLISVCVCMCEFTQAVDEDRWSTGRMWHTVLSTKCVVCQGAMGLVFWFSSGQLRGYIVVIFITFNFLCQMPLLLGAHHKRHYVKRSKGHEVKLFFLMCWSNKWI